MSILNYLKTTTAESHQSAEQKNLAKHIIDHTITQSNYEKLLLANYSTYYAIERYLNTNKDLLPLDIQQFIDYKKSKALAKDLKSLSVDIIPIQFPDVHLPKDPYSLIGALYVIEGSMLGGLMISKHLSKCKNLLHHDEHHFYGGNPEIHVKRWKNFCAAIENIKYSRREHIIAGDAALNVFNFFT